MFRLRELLKGTFSAGIQADPWAQSVRKDGEVREFSEQVVHSLIKTIEAAHFNKDIGVISAYLPPDFICTVSESFTDTSRKVTEVGRQSFLAGVSSQFTGIEKFESCKITVVKVIELTPKSAKVICHTHSIHIVQPDVRVIQDSECFVELGIYEGYPMVAKIRMDAIA